MESADSRRRGDQRYRAGAGRPPSPACGQPQGAGRPAPSMARPHLQAFQPRPSPRTRGWRRGSRPPKSFRWGWGCCPGPASPLSFRDPEAEARRGRGHPVPALGLLPRLRFPGGPHRWASPAVPSETGAQPSQDSKGRPRGCRNPRKACRGHRGDWELGRKYPALSTFFLPPAPH